MDSEAATSSHIEEMIQELAQQEGVEALATEMPQEGEIIEVGETSTLPDPLRSSPSSNPQLGKKILML